MLTPEAVATGPQLLDRTPPDTGPFRLLERTTTLPRATFVRQIDILAEPADRLAELSRRERDVRARVILEHESATQPSSDPAPPATVEIVEHTDERVVIRVETEGDGYLRLADPYDAGWRATIDGQDTEVFAADHYLRAVYVGPGEHEVVFTYDAARVLWPRYSSVAALLLILLLAIGLPRKRP